MLSNTARISSKRVVLVANTAKTCSYSTAAKSVEASGIWSDFKEGIRDESSLKIKNPILRNELLNGVDSKKGPLTIKKRLNKSAYDSPAGLNEIFESSYKFLENQAKQKYDEIASLKEKLTKAESSQEKSKLISQIKTLRIEAEKFNPEVLYKAQFSNPENIDLNEPVFQYYYKTQKFDGYDKMLLMQRIEQLHILPDAIPTINPDLQLNLKFVNHSGVNKFITPGEKLSTSVTSKPPIIQINNCDLSKDFTSENATSEKFMLMIVNLDDPNLETNSYNITLNYLIKDIELNANSSTIKPTISDPNVIAEYLPPVPEKNAPANRFVTLLFKQPEEMKEISVNDDQRGDFRLAEFIGNNGLVPVGINCWRSVWDSEVSKVREMYGLSKGRVFHRVRR